ncbi:MAG: TlpA disulfide reductase family protein [Salegentibacter sp.]
MSKNKNNKKRSLIQYAIFGVIAMALYATGLHTEVIGFAQRGLLETGMMDPVVDEGKEIAQVRPSEGSPANETANKPKADFSLQLKDENGKIVSLSKFKGKVIFINIWATWCPPCVAEMPGIDELHQEMDGEVAFVMLSVDQYFETAKSFKERKNYELPIYALAGNLPAMYQSSAIPTTFVIDAEGNLALTHKGMADYNSDKFKKFLRGLK